MDTRSSFTDIEYSLRKQPGKREELLLRIDALMPWAEFAAWVSPYYPKGQRGRSVKPLETMLRLFCLQNWFGLSAAGMESAVYDSYAFRKFIGLNFLEEQVPDSSTLCRFRRLLKKHGLDTRISDAAAEALLEAGLKLTPGSVVEPYLRPVRKKAK